MKQNIMDFAATRIAYRKLAAACLKQWYQDGSPEDYDTDTFDTLKQLAYESYKPAERPSLHYNFTSHSATYMSYNRD